MPEFLETVFEARSRLTGLSYVGRSRYASDQAWARIVSQADWSTKPLQSAITRDGADSFDVVCLLRADYRVTGEIYRDRLAQIGFWPESYNLSPRRQSGPRQISGPNRTAAKETT